MISLGTLLPDLDREYWFVPAKKYAEEQNHRALLHNVVVMAFTFLVNTFLSLGVFLHVLQDSFTTVKDRGVEWFFPFTRLAKRGRYDANGIEQSLDPREHVYLYQEDPPGFVKLADTDLQEPVDRPVPWRRVYGFALNGHLLDRGFLFGSIAAIIVWLFVPSLDMAFTNLSTMLQAPASVYGNWLFGLLAIGSLFFAGEIERSDKPHPVLAPLKKVKIPLFVIGLTLFSVWNALNYNSIAENVLRNISQPFQILAMVILTPIIAVILVRLQTKGGKEPAII